MPSTAIDSQIHGFLFSTDEMREIFSDRSWAQKWLDTEAALAAAQAELGIIPQEKADIIVKHADADLLDIPSIGEFYKSSITIVPLLKAFKAVLPDNAGEFVHWGATSQNIVDTGLVLLQRDAYKVILRDMELCREYCLDLAEKYRNTVMAGRTHVVHAIPITFGYKAAVWADELGRNVERLKAMAPRVFVGELAGAVGTLASMPEQGLEVQRRTMEKLGLGVPTIAWTTEYVRRDWIELIRAAKDFPHLLMIELIERLFRKHCTEVRQVIEARALPEEGARHLNAATGSPALRIVRNYVDESGEILLSTVSYHPGDRYAFNLNARVPEHKRNERLDETLFDRLRNGS